jgi:predicted MFS family arabinose efflux permease
MKNQSTVFWVMSLLGAAYLAITMGLRQTVGLYVPSLQDGGLSIATISLALAIGQLAWGLIQPVAGAMADRFGHVGVLIAGAFLLFIGIVVAPWWLTPWGVIFTFGILSPLGSGIGSFSTLIGMTARAVPADKRSLSTGIVNAGGSMGQFTFAPLIQTLITYLGMAGALFTSAFSALLAIPLAWWLHQQSKNSPALAVSSSTATTLAHPSHASLRQALGAAFAERDYLFLHLSFLTCGFHVAFLVTHLKVEVVTCHGLSDNIAAASLALIGLFNIAGSLLAGYWGERMRMSRLLAFIYGSRAIIVLLYLIAPKTDLTYYAFAASLGLTWLATVPPTAGLVGRMFGTQYLATIFGMTLVSHQVGGFFGAYLGGLSMTLFGDYSWMWWADIALALFAAVVSWPIRDVHANAYHARMNASCT